MTLSPPSIILLATLLTLLVLILAAALSFILTHNRTHNPANTTPPPSSTTSAATTPTSPTFPTTQAPTPLSRNPSMASFGHAPDVTKLAPLPRSPPGCVDITPSPERSLWLAPPREGRHAASVV